jgi:hypothetical protein
VNTTPKPSATKNRRGDCEVAEEPEPLFAETVEVAEGVGSTVVRVLSAARATTLSTLTTT